MHKDPDPHLLRQRGITLFPTSLGTLPLFSLKNTRRYFDSGDGLRGEKGFQSRLPADGLRGSIASDLSLALVYSAAKCAHPGSGGEGV